MKRTLCLLLALLWALPLAAAAEFGRATDDSQYRDEETGLYFYYSGDQTGLMTGDGTVLLEPCLTQAPFRFSEGLACVQKTGAGWGYIDVNGRWVVEPTLREAYDFRNGIAIARDDKLFGILNAAGSWAIEPQFTGIIGFSEGLCTVRIGEKWGFLDEALHLAIDAQYDDAGLFSCGLAAVKVGDVWGYIDASGQMVIPPQYKKATAFELDMANVTDEQGTFLMDRAENEVLRVPDAYAYTVLDESTVIVHLMNEADPVYYARTDGGFEAVAMVGSSFQMEDYYPNEGGSVAQLDEPATLNKRASTQWRLPRVDGATALFPVYAALVEATYPDSTRYEDAADNPDALITCTKTREAYYRLVDGEADILFVAGPSEAQQAYADAHGVTLELTPIAREAFVFIVNPENPLSDISTQQIRDVYSGRTTQWSDLGVADLGEIIAYQRPADSGSQTALEALMDGDALMEAPQDNVAWDMGDILNVVEYRNFPNAIGYSFRFYVTGLMQAQVKLLSVDGVAPTPEHIASGTYPLITQIYAVTRQGDENPNTAAFLEWIQSEQAAELIEKSGYVPEAQP